MQYVYVCACAYAYTYETVSKRLRQTAIRPKYWTIPLWNQCHLRIIPKIIPTWYKHPPTSTPKSINLGLKISLGGASWRGRGGSWRGVGGSWGHLGPKMAPRALHARICKQKLRLLGAKLGPKINQNLPQKRPEMLPFFLIHLKIDFWRDLVPTWPHLGPENLSKMGPSWLQNRCKWGC